jgi:CCR4-NOT complex subunit CAF16
MISIKNLSFNFDQNSKPIFNQFTVTLPQDSRVLLIGANGTGKSTLLRILSGLHLIKEGEVLYQGQSIFETLTLQSQIKLVSGDFPFDLDIPVSDLLKDHLFTEENQKLYTCLEIDSTWRMHQVSEGQRRRVQLFLSLKNRPDVLLLDEVTAHLDVVVRNRLLNYLGGLKSIVIYATHIFDELHLRTGFNPTHILGLGKNQNRDPYYELIEFNNIESLITKEAPLSQWVQNWIQKNHA